MQEFNRSKKFADFPEKKFLEHSWNFNFFDKLLIVYQKIYGRIKKDLVFFSKKNKKFFLGFWFPSIRYDDERVYQKYFFFYFINRVSVK